MYTINILEVFMSKQTVSLQLDTDLINRIKDAANKEGLTLSAYVRRLLILHISKERVIV